jgi:PAS domain S-box-containing protein
MILILILSILAQLVAVLYAFRIIKATGRRSAWVLIIVGLLVMVLRRFYLLISLIFLGGLDKGDSISESFAFLTSLLISVALFKLSRLFIDIAQSEKYFRTLLENASDVITILNLDGSIRYKSPSSERVLGYKNNELDGQNAFHYIHPDDAKKMMDIFNRGAKESGFISKLKYRFRHKDGSWRTLDGIGRSLIRDPIVRGILINSRDITEKEEAEKELRENERFLKSVFSSIQDGISVLDKDMNIIRVNPVMERWYNHAMPLIGKKCYEAYYGKHERCKVCPSFQSLSDGLAAYEMVPKAGPGGKILGWFDLYSFPLIDFDTGVLKGVIEYVRDISERKSLEDERENLVKDLKNKTLELETTKGELEEFAKDLGRKVLDRTSALKKAQDDLLQAEKLSVLGKVSASLSHEIRNPLSVIKNAVFYLKMMGGNKDIKKETEYLDMIKRQVEIADRIIANTLDFARSKKLKLEKVFINSVIDNVLSVMNVRDHIKIEKNFLATDSAWGDLFQVGQVFFNLILNGIESITETGSVNISTENSGDFIKVVICDTGSGIKEEDLPKIFDPLFTTKPMGIGLGLDIVKNIVLKHDGNISVESEVGKGTKIIVNFPRVKE